MALPGQSTYTLPQAGKALQRAFGENISRHQLLDWCAQGLLSVCAPAAGVYLLADGDDAPKGVSDQLLTLRFDAAQALALDRGERIAIREVTIAQKNLKVMRRRAHPNELLRLNPWAPDCLYVGAAMLVIEGKTIDAFIAKFNNRSDEILETPHPPTDKTAETVNVAAVGETTKQRRHRWLHELEAEAKAAGERGALARLAKRSGVDRSKMGKQIEIARGEREEESRGGITSHLVQMGKRPR